MKRALFLSLMVMSIASFTAVAQTKIDLQPNDTVRVVLERNIGQTVELRLKSGEKIGGKVEKVSEKLAHLSQLTGAEYFDAVVNLDDVAAIVVRKGK